MSTLPKRLYDLRKFAQRKWGSLEQTTENLGMTRGKLIVISACAILAISLSFNIYVAVSQATKNYELLSIEDEKLQAERKVAEELQREEEYYKSLEYKQRYAYESLNLAKPGEKVYVIETEGRADYRPKLQNNDPIKKDDEQVWWQLIVDEVFKSITL